jgi:hypothetical protein
MVLWLGKAKILYFIVRYVIIISGRTFYSFAFLSGGSIMNALLEALLHAFSTPAPFFITPLFP